MTHLGEVDQVLHIENAGLLEVLLTDDDESSSARTSPDKAAASWLKTNKQTNKQQIELVYRVIAGFYFHQQTIYMNICKTIHKIKIVTLWFIKKNDLVIALTGFLHLLSTLMSWLFFDIPWLLHREFHDHMKSSFAKADQSHPKIQLFMPPCSLYYLVFNVKIFFWQKPTVISMFTC